MLLAVLKRVAMAVSFACRDVLGFNACCTCVLCAGGADTIVLDYYCGLF